MRAELGRRARIARHQAEAFADLGRLSGPFTGGLFWRFELGPSKDAMSLYRAARAKNVLVSPGCFFRSDGGGEAEESRDAWIRINVSRCEGSTLTTVLRLLREASRSTQ
jgi:DNA-binding transcriptional MocR family regulator